MPQSGTRYPCCGARIGMWHNEWCFERAIFPDDNLSTYDTPFGVLTLVKRGETYQRRREQWQIDHS
jgi:hypothetical protein